MLGLLLCRQHLDQERTCMPTSASNSQRNFLSYFSWCTQSSRALWENRVNTTGPSEIHCVATSETEIWQFQRIRANGYIIDMTDTTCSLDCKHLLYMFLLYTWVGWNDRWLNAYWRNRWCVPVLPGEVCVITLNIYRDTRRESEPVCMCRTHTITLRDIAD